MAKTFTKAQAVKLLNAGEMKLFEESRVQVLRTLSASQIDRRIIRMREVRDRARDLLQRQRVALQAQTGSKRGTAGTANQQRSKDKVELVTDMLRRFEGQLKIARKAEAAGNTPTPASRRSVSKKAAKSKAVAPDKDFTAHRMRVRNTLEEQAGRAMRARKSPAKTAASSDADSAPKRATLSSASKTPAKKAAAKKVSPKAATTTKSAKRAAAVVPPRADGETRGKRTASIKTLQSPPGNAHAGFNDARAHNTAQQRKFQDALVTPIQAHLSSRNRRAQGKRDSRG